MISDGKPYRCAYCGKDTAQAPVVAALPGWPPLLYPSCCLACATHDDDRWRGRPLETATPALLELAAKACVQSRATAEAQYAWETIARRRGILGGMS